MALDDTFRDRRADYEIVTIHDSTVSSLEQLRRELVSLEEGWGRSLPFGVLLDAGGDVCRSYGVERFPTSVAISPEGVIVSGGADALRDYLLLTDADVVESIDALQQASAEDFGDLAREVLARKHGAFVLRYFGEQFASPFESVELFRLLEASDNDDAVDFLLGDGGLNSESEAVRLQSVQALGRLLGRRPGYESALLVRLELEGSALVRREILASLRGLGYGEAGDGR